MKGLAAAHAEFELDAAVPEVQSERYHRKTLRLGLHAQLLYFLPVDEQLAVSPGSMVEAVSELVYRNVHSAHVQLIPQDGSIRAGQSRLAMAHDLYLGTCQLNTALDPVEYGIVVPSLAVYGKIAGRRMFFLGHALFVVAVHCTERRVLRPLRLRIFGTGNGVEVDFGDELAFRDFAKSGIDLVLIGRKRAHQRLFAVDELLLALRDEIHENGHRRYAFVGFLQEFDVHYFYSTSEKEARIISNTAFSVKEHRPNLEGLRIEHGKIGRKALLDLAERVAETEFDRLVPGRDAHEILKFKTRHVAEILEALVHPERRTGKVAALDKTGLAALELDLESAHLERIAVLAVRTTQGVRDHLDVSKVPARKDETQHVVAQVDAVADDFGIEILDQKSGADHADLTVVERRHLVAEVRHVAQALVVRRHELLELRARVAAAGDDSALEARRRKRSAAWLFRSVRDHLDGRNPVDREHFLHIRLADELRILGAAALGIDERTFKVDARNLRELRGLTVFGHRLGGGDKIVVADREGRGKERRAALGEFGFGDLLDRLRRGVAHVMAASAMEMHIYEPRNHVGAIGVEHPIVLAGLGRLRYFRDFSVRYLDGGARHVCSGADDMGVDYDCLHLSLLG